MITLKSNFIGFLAIALILTGMNLPWVTAGYSVDGVITPPTSLQTEIRYKESLTYDINLFGHGQVIYYTLYQDKELIVKYNVRSDINKWSWIVLAGAIIILIGSLIGYGTLLFALSIPYVELIQVGFYLVGAIFTLVGILLINLNYEDIHVYIDKGDKTEVKTLGDIKQDVKKYLNSLPNTFLGVENFCSFGFGTFITFLGFLIAFAFSLWVVLKRLFMGKKEEFYIE